MTRTHLEAENDSQKGFGERLTPNIEVIEIDNGFLLFDDRGRPEDMPFWFGTREEVARYVSKHSTEAEFYAVGDWVKRALNKLGIDRPCLPCAKRQAKLNRTFRRPAKDPIKQSRKRTRMARRRQRR
jgi:hypothetical protein